MNKTVLCVLICIWFIALVASKKPGLNVKVYPLIGFSPIGALVSAQLTGEESQDFYCPGIEWNWGDGTKAYQESDCSPWEGHEDYPRFWSKKHVYGYGDYTITVNLQKSGKTLLAGTTFLQVR